MIDIHCHILPNIDDGAADIHESIEMARIASRDGITKIVATPHIKDTLRPPEIIQREVDTLNGRLVELGIPLKIFRGADVNAFIDPSFLDGYTINGTSYILMEFPHSHLPRKANESLFNVTVRGLKPIITHPERNPSVIKDPGILLGLLETGARAQITAESLTGAFGDDARECAFHLLKRGAVAFMATDAHSSRYRRPVLSEGLRIAENIIGKEKALKLVTSNPGAVIAGDPIHD